MTTAVSTEDASPTGGVDTSLHYRIRLPKSVAAKFERDRDTGHRYVMSLIPDGLGEEARMETATLWYIEPGSEDLLIRTTAIIAGMTGVPMVAVEAGSRVRLRMTLEAVRAMSSPLDPAVVASLRAQGIRWITRRGRIDDAGLQPWIESQLLKNGWEILEIKRIQRRSESRRKARMHLVDVDVSVVVVDAEKANTSLREGIGRGRSFGAGLVSVV